MKRKVFPFSAVMGQEKIKNAIIWNLVNPRIGGVLISGQKGTAKSTLVRASERISDRRIIELPLNITEDRLVGAIDFEYAVKYGKKKLDRGILASADRNILYADEINLLSDNIVKALLEAASDGMCRVEREGISDRYRCRFLLIGSMNPEESGLRPQLLDRFGLYVDTVSEDNSLVRCEIIRKRIEFERDPDAFIEKYREEDEALKKKIEKARKRLDDIAVTDSAYALAARLAAEANCSGSRGEIAIIETALAICALNGSSSVNKDAITEAAKYALPHRMKDTYAVEEQQEPPEAEDEDQEESQEEEMETDDTTGDEQSGEEEDFDQSPPDYPENETDQNEKEDAEESGEEQGEYSPDSGMQNPGRSQEKETVDEAGDMFEVGKWLDDKSKSEVRKGSGRRSLVKTTSLHGRYVKSTVNSRDRRDIAFDATLRAAAPHQKSRDKNGKALAIETGDIRTKVREKRTGNFIVFVVDASGSMGVGKRMSAVKGAILSLLSDAYQKRDKVALVTFRKDSAEIVLGMTRSVDLAAKKMEELATGGKTPLYAGLETAHNLIRSSLRKEKDLLPVLVLISDGRATSGRGKDPFADAVSEAREIAADNIKSVVIDVEQDFIKLKLAKKIGEEMNAEVYEIDDLHAGAIVSAIDLATKSRILQ